MGILAGLFATLCSCSNDYKAAGNRAFLEDDFDQAAKFYKIAYATSNKDPEVNFNYAVALMRTGRHAEAQALLRPLLVNPNFGTRAALQLVRSLIVGDRLSEALQIVEETRGALGDEGALDEALALIKKANSDRANDEISALMQGHLGDGGPDRVRWITERMIAARPTDFENLFTRLSSQLETDFNFADRATLRPLIDNARSAVIELETLYRKRIATDKTAFEARYVLSEIARARGDFAEAEQLALEVIRMNPEDISDKEMVFGLPRRKLDASACLTQVLESTRRYVDGAKLLEEASTQVTRPEDLVQHLARFYYLNKDFEKLEDAATKWVNRDGAASMAIFYLGQAAYARGDYDQALIYLDKAYGRNPQMALFNYALGTTLNRMENYQRAVTHLEAAKDLDPGNPDIILEYSRSLDGLGEPDTARRVVRDALLSRFRDPKSSEHKKLLAALNDMYKRAGHSLDTLDEARKVHLRDPGNPFVALRLAQLEADAKNFERARNLVLQVQRAMPDNIDGWRIGARFAYDSGQYNSCLTQLKKVEALAPGDPVTPWVESRAYVKLRRYDDARKAAQLALQRDPKQPGPALVLLDIELNRRDFEAALRVGRPLLQRFPSDPEIQRGVATALAARRDFKEAAELLINVEAARPFDPATAVELGEALVQSNRRVEGIDRLRRALAYPKLDQELKRRAARGLMDAKDFTGAAIAFQALISELDRGELRNRSLSSLAAARHYARDQLGALESIVELRRSQEPALAMSTFVFHATESEAWHEAAAAASVAARENGLITPHGLRAATRAFLAVGDWNAALRSAKTLEGLPVAKPGEAVSYQARAYLGLKEREKALGALLRSSQDAAQSETAIVVAEMLAYLTATRDFQTAATLADEAVLAYPTNPTVSLQSGIAFLEIGKLDKAVTMLANAATSRRTQDDAAFYLACVHIVSDRLVEARAAVSEGDGPKVMLARQIISAFNGEEAPAVGTFAGFLWNLGKRQFDQARRSASLAADLPLSVRGALADLVVRIEARPESARLIALALGRTWLLTNGRILEHRIDQELAATSERHQEEQAFLQLYRAFLRLKFGSATAAAQITSPLLEQYAKVHTVAYLHAGAALESGGPTNALKVLQAIYPKDLPRIVAVDIAKEMVEHGQRKRLDPVVVSTNAATLLKRCIDLIDADRALLATYLANAGDGAEAAAIVEELPVDLKSVPELQLVSISQRLFQENPEAAKAELRNLVATDSVVARLDVFRVVEALVRAQAFDLLPQSVQRALSLNPYDAYTINRLHSTIPERRLTTELRGRLEKALTVVDPLGNLRQKPRAQRFTAPWWR